MFLQLCVCTVMTHLCALIPIFSYIIIIIIIVIIIIIIMIILVEDFHQVCRVLDVEWIWTLNTTCFLQHDQGKFFPEKYVLSCTLYTNVVDEVGETGSRFR